MIKRLPILLASLFLWTSSYAVETAAIVPGQKAVFPIDLEKREIRWIKSSGLSGYERGEAAIAVPEDFDPAKTYPVLVTCVTGDRYMSNIREMDKYWPQAVEKGWVVVTGWADPHPERDTVLYRRAVTVAAMRELHRQFPGSISWPVAVGGFSGGSKNAPIMAAYLQEEGARIVGIFMAGCNRDLATYAMKRLSPDREAFLEIPLFLSTGTEDRVSTIEETKTVVESLEESGFLEIRFEQFTGTHYLNREHVPVALEWFESFLSK